MLQKFVPIRRAGGVVNPVQSFTQFDNYAKLGCSVCTQIWGDGARHLLVRGRGIYPKHIPLP